MREQIWLIRLVDSERSLRAVGRGHQLLRGILRRGYELRRPAFASPVAIHDLCHGLLVWFHYKHPLVLPWPTVVPGKQLGIHPDLARNWVEMVAVWAEAATCMHLCSSVLGPRVRNRRQMRMIEWSESSRFFVSCESPESSRWLTLLCEYLSCAYHTLCSICLEGLCLLRRSLCSYKKGAAHLNQYVDQWQERAGLHSSEFRISVLQDWPTALYRLAVRTPFCMRLLPGQEGECAQPGGCGRLLRGKGRGPQGVWDIFKRFTSGAIEKKTLFFAGPS